MSKLTLWQFRNLGLNIWKNQINVNLDFCLKECFRLHHLRCFDNQDVMSLLIDDWSALLFQRYLCLCSLLKGLWCLVMCITLAWITDKIFSQYFLDVSVGPRSLNYLALQPFPILKSVVIEKLCEIVHTVSTLLLCSHFQLPSSCMTFISSD